MRPFYLDDRLAQALGLYEEGPCPLCGRPTVEEPTLGGTMFRCRAVVVLGEQPASDAEAEPTHWFFAYAP